jgi:hypothetical protein
MIEKSDHDKITEIHAVLLGVNGNPGLCKRVESNTKNINKLWIAVVVIALSTGGGIYGLVQALL